MQDQSDTGTRSTRSVAVDDAADALLHAFRDNGVEYFFNSPGTEFAPLWDQFAERGGADGAFPTSSHGVKYVGCRHEELALHMAMGYTLLTGEPQVVGLHVNVGTLHGAMSLHAASRSRIPMVLLTSHVDTHEGELPGGTPGSHYLHFDAPGGFENYFSRYVKWLAHPERSETLLRYLARAFRVADSSPSGPVLLNVARELLYEHDRDRYEVYREATATPPAPSPAEIDALAERLQAATNPLIVAGMGACDPEAATHLRTLAERLHAPVIQHPKWYNVVPVEHPLSLGDRTFLDHFLERDVDLVFVVDSERPWYPPAGGAPSDATVVALSPEPVQSKLDYWNYPVDHLLTGEPSVTLPALVERVADRSEPGPVDWAAEHDRLRETWNDLADAGAGASPIDPFALCRSLDRSLPDDAVVVEETTVHKGAINNLITTKDRLYLGAGRALAGGRGGGLGIALGAKLAEPDRPVVALIGDGAYHYNPTSAAFGAAREYGLPFMTVVFDNGGYSSQRSSHERHFPDGRAAGSGVYPGTSIRPTPDYAGHATAYGATGSRVEDPDDVEPAVLEGLDQLRAGRSVVLDVVVDRASPRDRVEPPA